jgi:hypothetical protein
MGSVIEGFRESVQHSAGDTLADNPVGALASGEYWRPDEAQQMCHFRFMMSFRNISAPIVWLLQRPRVW